MSHLPTVCDQCEDPINLVTEQNGVRLKFSVLENLELIVSLHNNCSGVWCAQLGIPVPVGSRVN